MSSLRDLQHLAYRAIVLDASGGLPSVRGEPAAVAAGLGVYRNNAREAFRRVLADTFPAIASLVGDTCFRDLAGTFARNFPSRHGDLGRYGAEFPNLLDVLYRDTEFAYLADTARLEWSIAAAEMAPDEDPLDLGALERIDPADYGALRFRLRAGTDALSSQFPIHAIWRAQRDETVTRVALDAGADHVLIFRQHGGVTVERLDRDAFVLVRALADGDSLADAVAAVVTTSPGFDAPAALKAIAIRNLLTDFFLNDIER